jgi:hypothetical protein
METPAFRRAALDFVNETLQNCNDGFTVTIFNLRAAKSGGDSKLASFTEVVLGHFPDPSINRAEVFFNPAEDKVLLTGYHGSRRLLELAPQRTAEFFQQL